ncbi:Protein of unknown function [Amycolatopsis marina]|uniref:DUF559 domain-containing protein n=1 Tax=Amycolatopsis marina TaxID=490629 RepID=A0A1I1AC77_9PSEU|nr:DUF559 domain-containing protein [Amycolatopsis marina]SFB33963.1 Protein of unknown function [Amycolatopsis marina]
MRIFPGGNAAALRRDVAAEVGERALRSALASGLLVQIWRGVLVWAESSLEPYVRAAAALLVVGQPAVLSGRTAVALRGYSAAEAFDVHVTVPCGRAVRSRPGLVVHRRQFTSNDVVQLHGLSVLTLEAALADFLCDGDRRAAFASLDQALAALPEADRREFRKAVDHCLLAREDRRGVSRALMLTRLATGMADSPPESWLRLLVVEAGFPVPEAQYVVYTVDGAVLYVFDMAWKELRIALEYDGYAAHVDRADYDAERDRRMTKRGWITVRATAEDLRDSRRLLTELAAAFAARQC